MPLPEPYIVDLDDFHENNHSWPLLMAIKGVVPKFRVTLFTIPGRCSQDFLKTVRQIDWIDTVPHGWMHRTSLECQNWNPGQMLECLENAEQLGFTTRGFKAPGWVISNGCYQGLLERRYWVADQSYNNARRPKALPTYLLDSPYKIHGHVGGTMNNELSKLVPMLLSLKDSEFLFIREVM